MAGYALPDAAEEAAIVSGCRDGDREAFDALYRRYAPALRSYVRSRVRDQDRADDIAQEALIRAYEALPRFREGARFWSYLATVAANLCIDEHRRESRFTHDIPDTALDPDMDEQIERREKVRLVRDALPLIPDRYRTLLQMQSIDGWSLNEIADLEGLSISAVKTALSRARRALRMSVESLAIKRGASVSVLAFFRKDYLRDKLHSLGLRLKRLASSPDATYAAPRIYEALAAVTAVAIAGALAAGPATDEFRSTELITSAPQLSQEALASGDSASGTAATKSGRSTDLPSSLAMHGDRLLFPEKNAQPEDASLYDVALSPAYSSDRTMFASGILTRGCGRPSCPVVFKSSDGGATWKTLPASGFAGGEILLPPAYPSDARIFAATSMGLQVSVDGGVSFATLIPVAGPTVMSPAFNGVDPRILIGSSPTWEYRDDLQTGRPFAEALVGGGQTTFAFAPQYPSDRRIFAGSTSVDGNSVQTATIFVCDGPTCSSLSKLQGIKESPRLRLSPELSKDGTVFALAGRSLFRSIDTGRSFSKVAAPRDLADMALGRNFGNGDRSMFAAVLPNGDRDGGVWKSIDGGTSWAPLHGTKEMASGVTRIFVTPTGSLIGTLASADGSGGLVCSPDGGRTWARRCVAVD